jgi:hypothetical protein
VRFSERGGKEEPLEERGRACRLSIVVSFRESLATGPLISFLPATTTKLRVRQATTQLDDGWIHIAVYGLDHFDSLARIFASRRPGQKL